MSEIKKSKILTAARLVFLRYGYKRASMNDIAEATGVSRPALYVLFKNKEEIFTAVFLQWVDETISAIETDMAKLEAPEQKLLCAFERWTVEPFEMMKNSAEARELIECSFDFAQDSLRQGYRLFEAAITPAVTQIVERNPARPHMAPEQIAHILASATRGFKQTAAKSAELRLLIEKLLSLTFGLDKKAFRRPAKVVRT